MKPKPCVPCAASWRNSLMSKMMTVTYYHHSGFSVASGDVLLVLGRESDVAAVERL